MCNKSTLFCKKLYRTYGFGFTSWQTSAPPRYECSHFVASVAFSQLQRHVETPNQVRNGADWALGKPPPYSIPMHLLKNKTPTQNKAGSVSCNTNAFCYYFIPALPQIGTSSPTNCNHS
ncbi:unnamed protein product [Ixodes pacificus]